MIPARTRRDTGPTPAQKRLVVDRSGSRCEICNLALFDADLGWLAPHSFHHRQPRGMGGSKSEANTPDRLLLLCGHATTPGGCHTLVESQRALAYANGWLVKHPTDPATVPVVLFAGRLFLTHTGTYQEA